MIRFKDKEFEEYSICPATGEIFDAKTGEVQKTKVYHGRPVFKRMPVHRIMAYTFYGYKPGLVVHHKDENPFNNSLSNLMYLSKSEHIRLHHKGKLLSKEHKEKLSASMKGKKREPISDETKAKISVVMKGKPAWNKGKKLGQFSDEHKAKISAAALLREARKREAKMKVQVLDDSQEELIIENKK